MEFTVISYDIALNTATDTIDPRIPTTHHWALIANFIYVLISFGWAGYRQSGSLPSQGSTVHHKADVMQNLKFCYFQDYHEMYLFFVSLISSINKLYMSVAVHWARLQTVCGSPAQLSRLCWRGDCLESFHHQGWGSWKSSTSKISIWQRSDILYKQGQILFFVICIKMFRLVFIVYFASLSSHHTLRFEIPCINFIHSRFIKTNKEWEIFFIRENKPD